MATNVKPACIFGSKCYRKNKQHIENYYHGDDKQEEPPAKKPRIKEPDTNRAKESHTRVKNKTLKDFFIAKEKDTPAATVDENKHKSDHTLSDDEDTSSNKIDDGKESENEAGTSSRPSSPENIKENIKQKFLVEMPSDFYAFWDFAKTLNPSCPNMAFKEVLGLELVGPYDVLGGRHHKARNPNPCFLRHWRYYYDPPEFTTVVRGDDATQFHMGYFRDDPKEMPAFVASNAAATNCQMVPRGENLFAAFNWFIDEVSRKEIKKKSSSSGLKTKLVAAAKAGDFPLELKTKAMKGRDKKVNCKLFHSAGMVVPVDASGVGYREVPETIADLKKMFKKVVDATTDADRDKAFDPLMELIMLIQFANDECDYGEGLELGLEMFCYGNGNAFKSNIINLTGLAYQLLGRHEFKTIIEAHLEDRRHTADLNRIN